MAHVRGGVLICGVLGCYALVLLACRPAGAAAVFGAAREGAVATATAAVTPMAASPAVVTSTAMAAGNAEWQRYTQEEWGLSFRYPVNWQVEPNPLGLTLIPPRVDGAPTGGGSLLLEPYTISPHYDLRDYVELRSRDGEHPSVNDLGNTFADPTAMPFAAVGDQVVYALAVVRR